jgi:peroxiredoxin
MLRAVKYIVLCFAFLSVAAFPVQAQFYFQEDTLVGKVAPDFNLPTLKKESVSFTEFRGGKNAILFFWATWCPHCREQLKVLSAKQEEIRKSGIQIILVDMGETAEVAGAYLKKQKIDFDAFIDEQETTGSLYELVGVPTLIFVSSDGNVKMVDHALPEDIVAAFQ